MPLRYEFVILDTSSFHAPGHDFHLLQCVEATEVMAGGELGNVAVQVLPAHLVERTVIPALQERPERFDPVCMGLSVHVFGYGVPHRLMLVHFLQAPVCPVIVRVDRFPGLYVLMDESGERFARFPT